MLTIFALPKAFEGLQAIIQENAIKSWCCLQPRPEIILFGDETGTATICRKYNLIHCPKIEFNKAGTPLVSFLFSETAKRAQYSLLAYLNADIILAPQLGEIIPKIVSQKRRFLLVSKRWDYDLTSPIDTTSPHWFRTLGELIFKKEYLHSETAIDVFIFPKNLFPSIPPFSIGRPGAVYDNWLIWYAKKLQASVIDISAACPLIHQNHPVNKNGRFSQLKQCEEQINLQLAGGYGYCYNLGDVDFCTDFIGNLVKAPRRKHFIGCWIKRFLQRIRDYFRFGILKNAI